MRKTEDLLKRTIVYLKHIKVRDATWASYLLNIILYDYGKIMCMSTTQELISTLEMCVALLCTMSMS